MHATKRLLLLAGLILGLVTFATAATADSINSITFETYNTGSINGQQGWMKTGPFDATVNKSTSGTASATRRCASRTQSRAEASATRHAPGLANAAGESTSMKLFKSSFQIGTTQDALQTGLHVSVSPDSGDGGRMTYVRFEDQADGVHVFFDDVTNPGPVGTESTFNERDIATLDRTSAHTIAFSVLFIPGPHNDRVTVSVDGVRTTGTTSEDYYRYDPEQPAHVIPLVSKMLFRVSGEAHPANQGNGFLVDGLSLSSSNIPDPHRRQIHPAPTSKRFRSRGPVERRGPRHGPGPPAAPLASRASGR